MHSSTASSPEWRPQLSVLALVALLGTLPFWLTDLDIRAAALFYHPTAAEPWFEEFLPLWSLLYQLAPLIVGLVALGALGLLAAGSLWPRFKRWRIHAIFVIATVVIGPGLVVNALFKDHWGRPRPHQTLALGGTEPYLPPLVLGDHGEGKSFPCGHSSVGYMLSAFFLLWLRWRRWLAWLALAVALLLGTLLGVGRMAAGDHFLSDVIWSAVMVHAVAMLLYFGVLQVPRRAAAAARQPAAPHQPLQRPLLTLIAYLGVAAVLVLSVMSATPVKQVQRLAIHTQQYTPPPRVLRLDVDSAAIRIGWADWPDRQATLALKGRGFGLPGTRVVGELQTVGEALVYQVRHRGLFTEKDSALTLVAVPSAWDAIQVRASVGNIRVDPLPADAPALDLDLTTDTGRILRDAG